MSKPIKISDKLYQRLKEQADSQGLTLQDALVELITTPQEGLTALESQLDASRRATASQMDSQHAQQTELQTLRKEVNSLRQQLNQLLEKRNNDVAVFNDWVETWNEIPSLSQRVSDIERLRHRHFWQDVEEA